MDSLFNFSETEKLIPARAIYIINMKSHLFVLFVLLLFPLLTHSAGFKLPPIRPVWPRPRPQPVWPRPVWPRPRPQPVWPWPRPVNPPSHFPHLPHLPPPPPEAQNPGLSQIKEEKATNQFSPPQPEETQIPGLSQIKEYFYNFGYLQNNGPFNDSLDEETVSAIKTYQQYFNLNVTGDLNDETSKQITLPRCGVPDMNFSYYFYKGTNTSWPKGNEWFPKGTKNLTYGFRPESEIPDNTTKVFRDAFTRWSQTTGVMMNFTETTYEDANIKIGFYGFNESVQDNVVGGSIIRLQQSDNVNITTGVMYLDVNKHWVLPSADNFSWSWEKGEFYLETVVMHQIGHLLGLDHSFEKDSVMYPTILPTQQRKVELTDSDNQTIHNHYAKRH